MKKLLLTVTLSVACVAAFAQGKVNFQNNSLHLVYWDPSTAVSGTNAGNVYLVGQGGQTMTIELWAGTSSASLARVSTTDFATQASPGVWTGQTLTMSTIPAGLAYFEIYIYDVAAGSYANAVATPGDYWGTSGMFTAVASSTIAYNSLVNHNSPALSTWADGTYALDTVSPNFRGAIMLTTAPEPTTLALAGLGAAALMIMRRRK